jgi:hypothetical protein
LNYIIRDNEEPDYELEDNFVQLSINCAPLSGLVFKTDSRKVHQLIHGLYKARLPKHGLSPRRRGRMDDLIIRRFRPTTEAKATSRSISRRLKSYGLHSIIRAREPCLSKSS